MDVELHGCTPPPVQPFIVPTRGLFVFQLYLFLMLFSDGENNTVEVFTVQLTIGGERGMYFIVPVSILFFFLSYMSVQDAYLTLSTRK